MGGGRLDLATTGDAADVGTTDQARSGRGRSCGRDLRVGLTAANRGSPSSRRRQVSNSSRFGTLSSNNRWEWWKEARGLRGETGGRQGRGDVNLCAAARAARQHGDNGRTTSRAVAGGDGIVGFLLWWVRSWRRCSRSRGPSCARGEGALLPRRSRSRSQLSSCTLATSTGASSRSRPMFMLGGLVIGIGGGAGRADAIVRWRQPRSRRCCSQPLLAGGAVAGGEPGRRRLHGLRAISVRGQRPRGAAFAQPLSVRRSGAGRGYATS